MSYWKSLNFNCDYHDATSIRFMMALENAEIGSDQFQSVSTHCILKDSCENLQVRNYVLYNNSQMDNFLWQSLIQLLEWNFQWEISNFYITGWSYRRLSSLFLVQFRSKRTFKGPELYWSIQDPLNSVLKLIIEIPRDNPP